MTLSVLIPARNEEWLNRTVRDVLDHSGESTDVIVVLDGAWPVEPLPQHPRVSVLYEPSPAGQRGAVNRAARISTARYVMKLDAHCALSPGFDAELIKAADTLGPEALQVPMQRNLHVYDWACPCGWRHRHGPHVERCPKCAGPVTREIVWTPRGGTSSTSWVFDGGLHFQYDTHSKKRPDAKARLRESMSLIGACWFADRRWFLDTLGGLDEAHGSWGQMGTELACKAWLSGGRVMTNTATWFAHFFRVGGLAFPYPISASEQDAARAHSRALWRANAWPGQVKPLRWLVEKFTPAGWTPAQIDELAPRLEGPTAMDVIPPRSAKATTGIVYYSDMKPDRPFLKAVARRLRKSAGDHPIVAVTLDTAMPSWLGRLVVIRAERGPLAMASQQLAGLEALSTDLVCFAEHDVLYPPGAFDARPTSSRVYAYAGHTWKVDTRSGRCLFYKMEQTSGLCADRRLLVDHYRRRVAHLEAHGFTRTLGFEPGKPVRHGGLDDVPRETWANPVPLVDLRHGANLTPSRWRREQFRNQRYTEGWQESDRVPGWPGPILGRFAAWFDEVTRVDD